MHFFFIMLVVLWRDGPKMLHFTAFVSILGQLCNVSPLILQNFAWKATLIFCTFVLKYRLYTISFLKHYLSHLFFIKFEVVLGVFNLI